MDLPKGFHKEVIEARENRAVDFTDNSLEKSVAISPLKPGGSNFKTHELIKKTPWKYAYRPSFGGILFAGIFVIVGLIVIIISLSVISTTPSNWIMFMFGAVFSTTGSLIYYFSAMPRVFDKQLGLYYKTYKVNPSKRDENSKKQFPLKSIIAIQVIGETISSKNGSYGSFELNLVLEDGSRKNVVDHGNLKSIIDDAHVLSDFLNVPIWHAETPKS
ncbi:MAG: hypothetical protein CMC76_11295 [Flavobacteriaceae bacterium]|nr:hypothetical protein [Flavobacteriaceae bacterium]